MNTLFLQSDVIDPYTLYERLLEQEELVYDSTNGIWAAYRYRTCLTLLTLNEAHIPPKSQQHAPLGDAACLVLRNLLRLRNPPEHDSLRALSSRLYQEMRPPPVTALLEPLLSDSVTLEWVGSVCKRLPALSILKGYGFSEASTELILEHLPTLVKLMMPEKVPKVVADIAVAVQSVYPLVEEQLFSYAATSALMRAAPEDEQQALISNLMGFLIQSYDAGRGLLSNALLGMLRHTQGLRHDPAYLRQVVIESLRFDPAVHNTRRVLHTDVVLQGQPLKAGERVLLVLAAANRDHRVFARPQLFDIARSNNDAHLTFGAGAHTCLAKHHTIHLTVAALAHLYSRFPEVTLLEEQVLYEPLVNARLPKRLLLALTP